MSNKATILILMILLASVSVVSAVEQRKIIKEELINSQYGFLGELLGLGDRLYKITYDNGSTAQVLYRSGFRKLTGAMITSMPKSVYVQGGKWSVDIPVTMQGISSVMDGQSVHTHQVDFTDAKGIYIGGFTQDLASGETKTVTYTLDISSLPAGSNNVKAQEYVYLAGGTKVRGDISYITITVPSSVPEPTSVIPTQQPTPVIIQTPPPTPASTATAPGGTTKETESKPAGAGTGYEEPSLLTSTNILTIIVLGIIAYAGYINLYVKKDGKKGKKRGRK